MAFNLEISEYDLQLIIDNLKDNNEEVKEIKETLQYIIETQDTQSTHGVSY